MSNLSNRVPESFESETSGETSDSNLLWQYVQSMSPETVAQLSKPTSNEVFQMIERTIEGMLGNLPSGEFGVTITTSRESLGRLLASAMINGYFLHNVEQRIAFEKSLQLTRSNNSTDS